MTTEISLKEKLQNEILDTTWDPVVPHFARGTVYYIDKDIILEDVGVAMATDDVTVMKKWIDHGLLYPPTAEQATMFAENKDMLFAMLIIEPYVLIQEK